MQRHIVYEVNIDVHAEIASDYAEWLVGHVERMRTVLHGMLRADICRRCEPVPCPSDFEDDVAEDGGEGESKPAPWVGFTVSYLVASREDLDDYLARRAVLMRQEAVERFGTKHFRANRRIMDVVAIVVAPTDTV